MVCTTHPVDPLTALRNPCDSHCGTHPAEGSDGNRGRCSLVRLDFCYLGTSHDVDICPPQLLL